MPFSFLIIRGRDIWAQICCLLLTFEHPYSTWDIPSQVHKAIASYFWLQIRPHARFCRRTNDFLGIALTLQSLFFWFPCSFCFCDFLCFSGTFFPSFRRILGVPRREKPLFFLFPFFPKKNKGWGQGASQKSIAIANVSDRNTKSILPFGGTLLRGKNLSIYLPALGPLKQAPLAIVALDQEKWRGKGN